MLFTCCILQTGCGVHHAKGDADLLTVQTTINFSATHNTVLIGEDTDILVLLCHHSRNTIYDILYTSEQKVNARKPPRCWNIRNTRSVLGHDVCENILFLHAILGCDTTSGVFGINKKVSLIQIKKNANFLEQAAIFMKQDASKEEVTAAGEHALVCLYGGHLGESINDLRLRRFYEKTSSRTQCFTTPKPTTDIGCHKIPQSPHIPTGTSLDWRVHSRASSRVGLESCQQTNVAYCNRCSSSATRTTGFISCRCKSGCNSMHCSCRKNGMDCSTACAVCRGVCSNISASDSESDDDSDNTPPCWGHTHWSSPYTHDTSHKLYMYNNKNRFFELPVIANRVSS